MGGSGRASSRRANSARRKPGHGLPQEDSTAAIAAASARVRWGAPGMRSDTPPKLSRADQKAAAIAESVAGKAHCPTDGMGTLTAEDHAWQLLLCMAGAHAEGDAPSARAELRRLAEEGRQLLESEPGPPLRPARVPSRDPGREAEQEKRRLDSKVVQQPKTPTAPVAENSAAKAPVSQSGGPVTDARPGKAAKAAAAAPEVPQRRGLLAKARAFGAAVSDFAAQVEEQVEKEAAERRAALERDRPRDEEEDDYDDDEEEEEEQGGGCRIQ